MDKSTATLDGLGGTSPSSRKRSSGVAIEGRAIGVALTLLAICGGWQTFTVNVGRVGPGIIVTPIGMVPISRPTERIMRRMRRSACENRARISTGENLKQAMLPFEFRGRYSYCLAYHLKGQADRNA